MSRPDLNVPEADAGRLAAVVLELSAITSRSPGSRGYAGEHRLAMDRQTLELLRFQPLWWQMICSPWAAWQLATFKKLLSARVTFEITEYLRLRQLVCRLRFGYVLDPTVVALLDQHIKSQRLTNRDAWRLTHSLGCRIHQGAVEPAPASVRVARFGCAFSVALAALCISSVFLAFATWCEPSRSLCGVIGYASLAYVTAHLSPFLLCLTWGRRKAGTFLAQLLNEHERATGEPRRLMESLVRMAW